MCHACRGLNRGRPRGIRRPSGSAPVPHSSSAQITPGHGRPAPPQGERKPAKASSLRRTGPRVLELPSAALVAPVTREGQDDGPVMTAGATGDSARDEGGGRDRAPTRPPPTQTVRRTYFAQPPVDRRPRSYDAASESPATRPRPWPRPDGVIPVARATARPRDIPPRTAATIMRSWRSTAWAASRRRRRRTGAGRRRWRLAVGSLAPGRTVAAPREHLHAQRQSTDKPPASSVEAQAQVPASPERWFLLPSPPRPVLDSVGHLKHIPQKPIAGQVESNGASIASDSRKAQGPGRAGAVVQLASGVDQVAAGRPMPVGRARLRLVLNL